MHRNPHPWRIMAVVFGGVLLCSFCLQKLFAPVGNAMLAAVDAQPATITGTIESSRSETGKFAIYDGSSTSLLSDQAKAATYAGRDVRIAGILHESTGILDIRSIEMVDLRAFHDSRP